VKEEKMKNLFYVFLILLFCCPISYANEWEKALDLNLTLTQNSYSDNWVGGEAGSVSWMTNSNLKAAKQLCSKFNWSNSLKLAFGQTHQQEQETKNWKKPFKSTDLIDGESVGRFTLDAFVDPYMAFRVISQFMDASVPEVKRYLNPLTLSESGGISKLLYKSEETEFLSRFGFGLRQKFNKEIVDTLNEKTETHTTNDGGFESVTDFKTSLAEGKITYSAKLTLFKAIFYSEADELKGLPEEDYWEAVDVNWENIFSANIAKYLTVNLYVQFLYDKEIDLKGRLKETLALGFTYRIF
jgi:hypothetical protein